MMIKISVTKEIYRRSMMCGVHPNMAASVNENCAVALAVRDIDPNASVGRAHINWSTDFGWIETKLPAKAIKMISRFDRLFNSPERRLKLKEFSFEVDFPDSLVEQIGIDQVREILTNSETLKLVEI